MRKKTEKHCPYPATFFETLRRRHSSYDGPGVPPAAGRSNRQIGAALGVDHEAVAKVRRELESVGQIAQQDRRTGKDGKTYKARKPIRYMLVA